MQPVVVNLCALEAMWAAISQGGVDWDGAGTPGCWHLLGLGRGWRCQEACAGGSDGCWWERWVLCRGVPARGLAGMVGVAVGSGRSRQSPGRRDSPLRHSQRQVDRAAPLPPCPSPAQSLAKSRLLRGCEMGQRYQDLPGRLGRREDESGCRECFEDEKHPCGVPRQPRTAPQPMPVLVRSSCSAPCCCISWGQVAAGEVGTKATSACNQGTPPGHWACCCSPAPRSSHVGGAVAANGSTCAGTQPAWQGQCLANATCTMAVTGG